MSRPHFPINIDDPFLTTKETAEMLGVSLRTIQLWCQADQIKHGRTPGGHRRIRRSTAINFAVENKMEIATEYAQATDAQVLKSLRELVNIMKRFGHGDMPAVKEAEEALTAKMK